MKEHFRVVFLNLAKLYYIGRSEALELHSHTTGSICICLDGVFKIKANGSWKKNLTSICVPPGIAHEIVSENKLILFLFIEPYDRDFKRLFNDSKHLTLIKSSIVEEIRENFSKIGLQFNSEKYRDFFHKVSDVFNFYEHRNYEIDGRITEVLKILEQENIDNIPVQEIAKRVSLSSSRLSHLFSSQLGIPIATYRIWIKLKRFSLLMKNTQSLTEAAHESGFYDSSHFANSFKKKFGTEPYKIFKKGKIHWILENPVLHSNKVEKKTRIDF